MVVALTVAPQLAESVQRVRRARRLRGGRQNGMRALRGIAIPVLEDALNRSLALAAAMASHGYGRVGAAAPRERVLTGSLVIAGLLGVCVGLYGVMDAGTPRAMGAPMLAAGLLVATAGLVLGGRRVRRSRYRPDGWRPAELAVAASGIATWALLYLTSKVDAANLYPTLNPLDWPQVDPLPALAIVVALLPAWLAPPPPVADPDDPAGPGGPEDAEPRPGRRSGPGHGSVPSAGVGSAAGLRGGTHRPNENPEGAA